MEKLVVMGGVGEDEMKGKHVLLTTVIYTWDFFFADFYINFFVLDIFSRSTSMGNP